MASSSDVDISEIELETSAIGSAYDASVDSTEDKARSGSSSASLLSVLRQPPPSQLARKRKILWNSVPPTGTKRCKGSTVNDPKNVKPIDRVKQYDSDYFQVSAGKLFCSACREEVSTKKSIIDHHINSIKHQKGKERLTSKKKGEQSIVEALKRYDTSEHPKGETLPDSVRIYRVRVLTSLLKSGIPLNKADDLRELLEENGYSLSSSTHLRQMVPFVLHEEVQAIQREMSGRPVSIIFDGTTHVAEAFVVVLRFVEDWCVKQRVSKLLLFSEKFDWRTCCMPTYGIFVNRARNSISSRYCCNARQGFRECSRHAYC